MIPKDLRNSHQGLELATQLFPPFASYCWDCKCMPGHRHLYAGTRDWAWVLMLQMVAFGESFWGQLVSTTCLH